jgi:NADH-quinone oxidoreductase subunit E
MARINPEPLERVLPLELYAQIDVYMDELDIDLYSARRKDTLIQVLHKAQGIFGFLPEEVQIHIANRYAIGQAEVSGVISFYNYFTTKPKGKVQISVCMGTACYVNGAEKVLQEFEHILDIKSGEVTADGRFSIESLRCVGACGLAPVVTINNKVYGKVQPGTAQDILEHYLVEVGGEEVPHYA